MTPKEEAIVQALGKLHAAGITQPKRDMVQAMSGNGKTLEGFKKNMGCTKKKGYLVYPDGTSVALTDKGVSHVGEVDPDSITNEFFHEEVVKPLLNKKASLIFDAISDGDVHQKKDVAEELGYQMDKLTGYEKDLSKMSKLGFLTKDKTTIQLTNKCFPLGRPE